MSEMVERVARAIWALNDNTDCHDYDQLAPHAKLRANEWARAAIAAMREPTAAQEVRMRDLLERDDRPPTKRWHWVWHEMIEAALA